MAVVCLSTLTMRCVLLSTPVPIIVVTNGCRQIMLQGYLEDPSVSFAAIGDVDSHCPLQVYTCCDESKPSDMKSDQVTEFAAGTAIDAELNKLCCTHGGGLADCTEAYCLAAYFFCKNMDFPNAEVKPILFFSGDEMTYPVVGGKVENLQRFVDGRSDIAEISTAEVFRELRRKFDVTNHSGSLVTLP